MDRRRPRGARRQRGAAAAAAAAAAAQPAQAVQVRPVVLPPYRLAGPVINPRGPRAEEIFQALYAGGNTNHLGPKEEIGRKFMPLPRGAPEIEATFFEYRRQFQTGDALADLLMPPIYREHMNRVGDKRREVLHYLPRSSNVKVFTRLRNDLKALMIILDKKIDELAELTNMVVPYPDYLKTFPALV